MYLKALVLYRLTWMNATAAYQPRNIIELMQANTSRGNGSSIVFPIVGNVYPLRNMDIGSDLTWLQCDTPCYHCSKGPNGTLYKHIENPLICTEPVCDRSLQRPESPCQGPDEQCDYEVAYTDHGASIGVLVRDSVHLNMTNGAVVAPQLAFGDHYYLGWAKLQYGSRPDTISLEVSFDSGRTHTYLNSMVYANLLSKIKEDLKGKQVNATVGSRSLPMCWEGGASVISYFKPLVLNFFDNNNTEFKMDPKSYLIIKKKANIVCLGILDGGKVGLRNINIIGAISMQNKLVIYDNENHTVGWAPANNCNTLLKP
ncbi:hypothetical protein OROMI_030657 [Orobanche minor]